MISSVSSERWLIIYPSFVILRKVNWLSLYSILILFWSIGLVQILNDGSSVFWSLHMPSFMPSQYPVKNYSRFVVISTRLAMGIDVGLSWCIIDALWYILDMLLCCNIHKGSIFQIWLYRNEGSDLTTKYYSLLWYPQGYKYF